MRALLIGLVGAVLSVGGASAEPTKGCNLAGAELVSLGDGTHYHVKSVRSEFWRMRSPEINDFKPDGEVVAVIEGGGKTYTITQHYSFYGMPNNTGSSAVATPKAIAAIKAGKRNMKAERFRVDGSFNLIDGPLGDNRLEPVKCG